MKVTEIRVIPITAIIEPAGITFLDDGLPLFVAFRRFQYRTSPIAPGEIDDACGH